MTTTTVHYTDVGIRTRHGAVWFTAILTFVSINLLLLAGVQSRSWGRPGVGLLVVGLVTVATARNLRRLGALEREHPEPTAAMRLAFDTTLALPMVSVAWALLF
jgi:hypothetical protein